MTASCTILICSCDKYQDILPPFFSLFKKYWPDCTYDIAISTESVDYHDDSLKINNLHPKNPSCSWTERIDEALSNIDSDQILPNGNFIYSYNLPAQSTDIVWTPSANPGYTGFYITKLKITLSSPSTVKEMRGQKLTDLCDIPQYCSKVLCCYAPLSIPLDVTGYKKIQISGVIHKPIPVRFLRSNQGKQTIYDIIKRIRRKIWQILK